MKKYQILPLFLVLFIDTFGTALIIPLLTPLIIENTSNLLSSNVQDSTKDLLFGVTLGIYSLMGFVSAPILGDLSDKFGRKKILAICLLGSALGYLCIILAIVYKLFWLVIVGRVIDGLTGGSMPISQAAIIDLSKTDDKAKNISLILLSASMGYLTGPMIAGILSDKNICSWFTLLTPFYFSALISFVNLILVAYLFKETASYKNDIKINVFQGLQSFFYSFKDKDIRALSLTFLSMQIAWSMYFQFISLFSSIEYNFTTLDMGLLMGTIGIGFVLAFTFVFAKLIQLFTPLQIAKYAMAILSLIIGMVILIKSEVVIWSMSWLASMSMACAYSTFITMFSNQVSKHRQGWVMGISAAISAFSFGVTGLLSSILAEQSPETPFVIAFAILVIGTTILFKAKLKAAPHA